MTNNSPPEEQKPEETALEPIEPAAKAADPVAALQRELEAVRGQSAEYLDGWRRAQADLINQRRRHEKERAELETQANARLIRQLLPILDDLERAEQTVPAELAEDQWAGGVLLIARKIRQILENEGVQPIPVQPGDAFDPNIHEALLHTQVEGFAPGQVVQQLCKGYKLGDRVLRPAQVQVAA